MRIIPLVATILALCPGAAKVSAHVPHECPGWLPETPAYSGHIEQADIVSGKHDFQIVFEKGRQLFEASFNTCDGQGRPGTTGTGDVHVSSRLQADLQPPEIEVRFAPNSRHSRPDVR